MYAFAPPTGDNLPAETAKKSDANGSGDFGIPDYRIAADAGYDSASPHTYATETALYAVRSLIDSDCLGIITIPVGNGWRDDTPGANGVVAYCAS